MGDLDNNNLHEVILAKSEWQWVEGWGMEMKRIGNIFKKFSCEMEKISKTRYSTKIKFLIMLVKLKNYLILYKTIKYK